MGIWKQPVFIQNKKLSLVADPIHDVESYSPFFLPLEIFHLDTRWCSLFHDHFAWNH